MQVIVVGTTNLSRIDDRFFKTFVCDNLSGIMKDGRKIEQHAEEFFRRLLKDERLSEEDMEAAIDDGMYSADNGDEYFIHHSTPIL